MVSRGYLKMKLKMCVNNEDAQKGKITQLSQIVYL